ncbi:unnamed protein product [Mytilus coruscus]|uniref:Uncharacterized protein n=1 Tax=Mytilus coruscus TaxID=42192 RepID=A0A6J8C2I2_MYTCO|nr:unnamed protein product [Mytilus coruscus]
MRGEHQLSQGQHQQRNQIEDCEDTSDESFSFDIISVKFRRERLSNFVQYPSRRSRSSRTDSGTTEVSEDSSDIYGKMRHSVVKPTTCYRVSRREVLHGVSLSEVIWRQTNLKKRQLKEKLSLALLFTSSSSGSTASEDPNDPEWSAADHEWDKKYLRGEFV